MPYKTPTDFEDALADLIDAHRRDGVAKDAIISAMELKKMALEDDDSSED
jgi:cation transport regulator ChaB